MNDLRYAIRFLSKAPGLVLTAVFSLAVGIGLNSVIFISVSGLLLAVALLASLVPAWRAAKVEPMEALRWE